MRTVTVRKEQSGKALQVRTGDMIRVELPTTGGTGYAWYVDNFNSEYLELVSEQTKQESEQCNHATTRFDIASLGVIIDLNWFLSGNPGKYAV